MRIAILADIHGNLTAFEAVLSDLREMSPDLILHGGDLADLGSGPTEIVDYIRDLKWPGVMGNTDQMLVLPDTLESFARDSTAPRALWDAVREIAAAARSNLGTERLEWVAHLPHSCIGPGLAIVHATPESAWRTLPENVPDAELELTYQSLVEPIVVFGHTHRPTVRVLDRQIRLVINTGSVGLPYDGDPRASYLLLDNGNPQIRRVEYDIEHEIQALASSGLPGADWISRMLRTGTPQLP
jgi:putative phosphoesterase